MYTANVVIVIGVVSYVLTLAAKKFRLNDVAIAPATKGSIEIVHTQSVHDRSRWR